MLGDAALWHDAARAPGRPGRRLAAQPGGPRRSGRPAVRLLGRGARPRATTSATCSPTASGCSRALADLAVPTIHFGVDTGELLGLMAAAGADVVGVDWRTPLDVARPDRRRHLRPRPARRRPGQPRPRRRACARGRSWRPRSTRSWTANARPARPRLQPGPRRAPGDRPRHPRAGGRHRPPGHRPLTPRCRCPSPPARSASCSWPTAPHAGRPTSSRTTRTSAGAGLPRRSSWPTSCAATRPSAGCRRWPSAPRRSERACKPRSMPASPAGSQVVLGLKHAAPTIEDGVAELAGAT